jgi:hypothetical protein
LDVKSCAKTNAKSRMSSLVPLERTLIEIIKKFDILSLNRPNKSFKQTAVVSLWIFTLKATNDSGGDLLTLTPSMKVSIVIFVFLMVCLSLTTELESRGGILTKAKHCQKGYVKVKRNNRLRCVKLAKLQR